MALDDHPQRIAHQHDVGAGAIGQAGEGDVIGRHDGEGSCCPAKSRHADAISNAGKYHEVGDAIWKFVPEGAVSFCLLAFDGDHTVEQVAKEACLAEQDGEQQARDTS